MNGFSHVSICFSLPRSRSQWLCWLYGHVIDTWHDPLKNCRSIDELRGAIAVRGQEPLFIADTSAILFHDAILAALPGVQRYYVLRDPGEVAASILRQTGLVDRHPLNRMYVRLEKITAAFGDVSSYDALDFNASYWHEDITHRRLVPNEYDLMRDRVIDMPLAKQYLTGNIDAFRELYKTREI